MDYEEKYREGKGRFIKKLRDWYKANNLISKLGNLKRRNVNFSLYEENPELFDKLGEKGVKFRNTPGWFNKRPYTVGNTVYLPKTSEYNNPEFLNQLNEELNTSYFDIGSTLAGEEVPHIAQYRNKGLLGFIKNYLKDLKTHGGQLGMYGAKESLEGFHLESPEEKLSLFNEVYK